MAPKLLGIVLGGLLSVAASSNSAVGGSGQAGARHLLWNFSISAGFLVGLDVSEARNPPEKEGGLVGFFKHRFPSNGPLEHNGLLFSNCPLDHLVQCDSATIWSAGEFLSIGWVQRPLLHRSARVESDVGSLRPNFNQSSIAFNFDPLGGSVTSVLDVNRNSSRQSLGVHIGALCGEIGTGLGTPDVARHLDGFFGRDSRPSSGTESKSDKHDAKRSYGDFGSGNEQHYPSPLRHVLLGLKIVLSALLFGVGVGMGVRGFERCGDASYVARSLWWLRAGGHFGLAMCGVAIMVAIPAYWLGLYVGG